MSGGGGEAELLALAGRWHRDGEDVAIATVTDAWGSAPRPPGSRFVVTRSGRMAGSVSGGCVESEVAARALEVLDSRTATLLRFDISNERAWGVGLACGGALEVFVEAVLPDDAPA